MDFFTFLPLLNYGLLQQRDEKLLTNNLPPAYDDATSVMLTEGVKKNGIQAHKLKGRNILP